MSTQVKGNGKRSRTCSNRRPFPWEMLPGHMLGHQEIRQNQATQLTARVVKSLQRAGCCREQPVPTCSPRCLANPPEYKHLSPPECPQHCSRPAREPVLGRAVRLCRKQVTGWFPPGLRDRSKGLISMRILVSFFRSCL